MKKILLLLLMVSFVGCGTSIKSLSDIKWSGNDTGISKKVETIGYYKIPHPIPPEAFVFYEDGTIVLCNRIPEDTIHYEGGYYPPGCIFDKDTNRWGDGTIGLYRIVGDTIYANMYFKNCFYLSSRIHINFETWMYKMTFKILDRTRIVWIDEHLMDKEFPNPKIKNDTLIFHRAEQLPPPNTYLKKKSWLWKSGKRLQ